VFSFLPLDTAFTKQNCHTKVTALFNAPTRGHLKPDDHQSDLIVLGCTNGKVAANR